MTSIAVRRILKDVELFKKNKEQLEKDGIYFHIDEANLFKAKLLIVPRHKEEDELVSPYTGGFFVFHLDIPESFPIDPPNVTFHPQTNMYRFHPNYYQTGKVCLSLLNTWGGNDWSPATSLMSLACVLEERFNERCLCFEPGHELASNNAMINYNDGVEYTKYHKAIIPIVQGSSPIYNDFMEVIAKEFTTHKDWHIHRLEQLVETKHNKVYIPHYYRTDNSIKFDYGGVRKTMSEMFELLHR